MGRHTHTHTNIYIYICMHVHIVTIKDTHHTKFVWDNHSWPTWLTGKKGGLYYIYIYQSVYREHVEENAVDIPLQTQSWLQTRHDSEWPCLSAAPVHSPRGAWSTRYVSWGLVLCHPPSATACCCLAAFASLVSRTWTVRAWWTICDRHLLPRQ